MKKTNKKKKTKKKVKKTKKLTLGTLDKLFHKVYDKSLTKMYHQPVVLGQEQGFQFDAAKKHIEEHKKLLHPNETGVKFDAEKPPLDLIPYEALEEVAKVLKHGMIKYKRANWAGGINYSRLIAAAMRHLNQFNSIEDFDKESGLCHVSHAATNLVFLLWMIKNRPDLDDRWIKDVKNRKMSSK